MATYRVIGFGVNEHGFFNQKAFTSSIGYACGFMMAHKQDSEITGAVLIKVEHESWRVIDEFGTENVSIVYGPCGTFNVTQSPALVMV